MRPSAFYIILCLVIAMIAVANINPVMPEGFVGSETYPLLLASQYGTFSEMVEMISLKGMPPLFPGDSYTPAAGIIWGGCYQVFGLDAWGYLLFNQLIHMVNVLLLVPVAMSLFGGAGRKIGFLGATLFALYPLSVDHVPVVARMPDLLSATLIMVTLILHAVTGPGRRAARIAAPVIAFFAFGVKEIAFLLPALLLIFDLCRGGTWKSSLLRALPCTLLLALYLVIRQSILGGPGGYETGDSPIAQAAVTLWSSIQTLLLPFGPIEAYRYGGGIVPFLGRLGAGLLAAFLWYGNNPMTFNRRGTNRPALFLAIWVGVVILLHLPLPIFARRDLYLASLPSSLFLVWLTLSGPRGGIGRIASSAALFLIVWQISFTPGFGGYQEWKIGDRHARDFLADVDQEIKNAWPDRPVEFPHTPWKTVSRPKRLPNIEEATMLSERSVKGYVALRYPEFSGEITVRPREVYVDTQGGTTF